MLKKQLMIHITIVSLLALLVSVSLVSAAGRVDTSKLREAVTVNNVRAHQKELQKIANKNGGTRVASSPGYDQSANYVHDKLKAAGYLVTRQSFQFPFFQNLADPELERVSPNPKLYTLGTEFDIMEYSGNTGDPGVTALLQPTNDIIIPPSATPSSTSGCEAADFPSSTSGRIALIQRGTCTFGQKAVNAQNAGAVGAIIFNEGQPGRTDVIIGTLGAPVGIPVVFASFGVGQELYNLAQSGDVTVRLETHTLSETRTTENIIGETQTGRNDRVVVVGAHLDSVAEGPGINDNGSGTGVILEIALQMAKLGIKPTNKVRFAFWGAEESGLLGSEFYVSQLSAQDIKNIALNLNFDMLGSPNFVRFVYDGDGSATPLAGPNGSKNIEQVFLDYFANEGGGLATEPTAFDGRSDYGPFIAVGIPAGGLFSGAEGLKTPAQVAIYGGTAGQQYDPCYHQACDTFENNNNMVLDQFADATAHAVLTFAQTTSAVNGTDKGQGNPKWIQGMTYRGSHLVK